MEFVPATDEDPRDRWRFHFHDEAAGEERTISILATSVASISPKEIEDLERMEAEVEAGRENLRELVERVARECSGVPDEELLRAMADSDPDLAATARLLYVRRHGREPEL
jgi:hypothetical protein